MKTFGLILLAILGLLMVIGGFSVMFNGLSGVLA